MNTDTTRDLFPETLLVEVSGSKVFTTSLKVAAHFKKQHKDVLKAIRKVIEQTPEEEQRRNFAPLFSVYAVKNGAKRRREYYMLSHDGFAILAMSFTGEEAMRWKWDFLDAFRAMERQLKSRDRRYVRAFSQRHPAAIPVVEMTQKGLSRAAISRAIGKSPEAITYHRRRMREAALLK